jgi:hypothetical protein
MRTIGITVKKKQIDGRKYPFFVRDKNAPTNFWIVRGPSENLNLIKYKERLFKASFLGNSYYHPFYYDCDIDLRRYQQVEAETIVLKFE